MKKINDIRTGRHCVFAMHVHLVFVTKYRRKVFNKNALSILHIIFSNVCVDFEATLIEMEGENDHVHLLVAYPPKLAISTLVNSLKGVSSRLLRKHFPSVSKHYLKNVLWSPSYFASSCGGAPINIIKEYIQQQSSPCS
jgi:putative transposase